jgi:hypothetical protein
VLLQEGKKKFDKKTAKFCQTQERTLSLSTKKQENVFQEVSAPLGRAADCDVISIQYGCRQYLFTQSVFISKLKSVIKRYLISLYVLCCT